MKGVQRLEKKLSCLSELKRKSSGDFLSLFIVLENQFSIPK